MAVVLFCRYVPTGFTPIRLYNILWNMRDYKYSRGVNNVTEPAWVEIIFSVLRIHYLFLVDFCCRFLFGCVNFQNTKYDYALRVY